PARRGLPHVAVRRPHPGRHHHANQTRRRPAAQPASPPGPGPRLHVGTRPRTRPHQPDLRRPVRPAALDRPGRNPRGPPRRRHTPRPAGRHRRRRRHPRHRPRSTARLPGLLPDPRRSDRGAGPGRTAPVGPPRQRRTRHRLANGRRAFHNLVPAHTRDRERQEFDMSEALDWNAKTIAEFRANEGRVGGNFEGAPLVVVHHRGRNSGREYVNPMMYLPHDSEPDIIYVFASKGGAPTNPDWYRNLTAAGGGSVERGTETYKVTVR